MTYQIKPQPASHTITVGDMGMEVGIERRRIQKEDVNVQSEVEPLYTAIHSLWLVRRRKNA